MSVTAPVEIADPAAAVFGSRMAADRWFCWEEPDATGSRSPALGSAHEVVSRGAGRFGDVGRALRRAAPRPRWPTSPPGSPPGRARSGPAGSPSTRTGAARRTGRRFPPALMVLPELSLMAPRRQDAPDPLRCSRARARIRRASARLGRAIARPWRDAPLPLLDPHPSGEAQISSAAPPERLRAAVAAAVERIRAGRAREKLVLAREVRVEAPRAHDPAAIFAALRSAFPSCFCFCCGSPEGAFLGASPELLVRRSGAGAATVALAGSTRRSADPAVDDHLGEQLLHSAKDRAEHEIVVRRIERALRPHAVWVEARARAGAREGREHPAPGVADPRAARASPARPSSSPACCTRRRRSAASRREGALEAIARLEGLDRGWYAGPVGWMDAAEDGEFCVALRSALLRDRTAHLFAGAGIVADSDPAAELAETELKLGALLPLLAGLAPLELREAEVVEEPERAGQPDHNQSREDRAAQHRDRPARHAVGPERQHLRGEGAVEEAAGEGVGQDPGVRVLEPERPEAVVDDGQREQEGCASRKRGARAVTQAAGRPVPKRP